MLRDSDAIQEVQVSWEFIRDNRNVVVANCNLATWAIGFNQTGIRDLCFNLLLASAFSVLEHVLRQMRDEGVFEAKCNQLGALMSGSRATLSWANWDLVDAGREERNQSVHHRNYLPNSRCRDYIAAIEQELVGWGLLPAATPHLWHW